MLPTVKLIKRLERVLEQGHPWIFADALGGKLPAPGKPVRVVDAQGRFVACGLAEDGPIGVRVFATRDESIDAELFARRIRAATALRQALMPPETDCFRLLHGEADRLPGVVCDLYADSAVLQFDGQAAPAWQAELVAGLEPVLTQLGVVRLILRTGRGADRRSQALIGRLPDVPVEVREHGMRLLVDLLAGQKTGMFLDQRESRLRTRSLSGGLRVLNLFGYTGGFSVAAGLGGASEVVTVDRDASACALAEKNWAANGLDAGTHASRPEPVQPYLESAAGRGERYDLIVCDPPSFAPSAKKVPAAIDAYRALHRAALRLLVPGGLYLAASCSSHVPQADFEKTLLQACHKDQRVLQIIERWGAPADHPKLAAFPEGDYLSVILARLVD